MPTTTAVVRDLDFPEIEAMLKSHRYGRLAFSFRDRVDIEPIHYVYEAGWLYGRTSPGTKLTVLAHHPWVAFEIDEVRGLLLASLDAAAKLEHHGLEARCRLILAQVEFMRNRFDQAASFLNAIPPDANGRTIGAELRAEVHYWWSRIHAARGDTSRAGDEADSARAVADAIAQTLPDADRNRFLRRSAIRRYQS